MMVILPAQCLPKLAVFHVQEVAIVFGTVPPAANFHPIHPTCSIRLIKFGAWIPQTVVMAALVG